jgi:sensor domain CHASE-containing protein
MVDQLALQTISIVIAATSVVIGVINSILVSRRDERRQNLLLKNQELSLETRQIGLYMDFTKVIQQSIDDYTDFFNQE